MRTDHSSARTNELPPKAVQDAAAARDAVAESNHRIAHNLSLVAGWVRLYAREVANAGEPVSNDKVCAILQEIGARVEAIAHLHGLLASHDRGQPIDLSGYLREIAETVVSSFTFAHKAALCFSANEACVVAPERALPVGLVVGELVTNAVKYAHPPGVRGQIRVGCRNSGGTIELEVADDGVGLPDGFDRMQDGGLGLRLVRSLARQLQGELAFDDIGVGLSVALRMTPAAAGA
ncbi:MAG: sensor histidine kinase [Pseudolabrys sp.]